MGLNENTTRATHAAKTRSMRTLASFYGAVFSQNDLAPLPPSALYCPPSRGGLIHELRGVGMSDDVYIVRPHILRKDVDTEREQGSRRCIAMIGPWTTARELWVRGGEISRGVVDMRAVAHGPRPTVSRIARRHIYRAVGGSVR